MKFTENRRQDVLTGGRTGTNAQTASTPFAELIQLRPRENHFAKDFIDTLKKLFARLSQQNLFPHPV